MGNGRADLEIPDVVEIGGDVVAGLGGVQLQTAVGQLGGQEEQPRETQQHKQAGADFQSTIRLHDQPLTNTYT
jgi:hypothetical protein